MANPYPSYSDILISTGNNNSATYYLPKQAYNFNDVPDLDEMVANPNRHLKVNSDATGLDIDTVNAFNTTGLYQDLTDVAWNTRTAGYALKVGATGPSGGIVYGEIPTGEPPVNPTDGYLDVNDTTSHLLQVYGLGAPHSDQEYILNTAVVTANNWTLNGTIQFNPNIAGEYTIYANVESIIQVTVNNPVAGTVRTFLSFDDALGNSLANTVHDVDISTLLPGSQPNPYNIKINTTPVILTSQNYKCRYLIQVINNGDFLLTQTLNQFQLECILQTRSTVPVSFHELADVNLPSDYDGYGNHPLKINGNKTEVTGTSMAMEEVVFFKSLGLSANINNRLCYWYTDSRGRSYSIFRPPVIFTLTSRAQQIINGLEDNSRPYDPSVAMTTEFTPLLSPVPISDNYTWTNVTDYPGAQDAAYNFRTVGMQYYEFPDLSSREQKTSLWNINTETSGAGVAVEGYPAFNSLTFKGLSLPENNNATVSRQVYEQIHVNITISAFCAFLDEKGNQIIRLGYQLYRNGAVIEEDYDTTTIQRPFYSGATCGHTFKVFGTTLRPLDTLQPVVLFGGFGGSLKPIQWPQFKLSIEETFAPTGIYVP